MIDTAAECKPVVGSPLTDQDYTDLLDRYGLAPTDWTGPPDGAPISAARPVPPAEPMPGVELAALIERMTRVAPGGPWDPTDDAGKERSALRHLARQLPGVETLVDQGVPLHDALIKAAGTIAPLHLGLLLRASVPPDDPTAELIGLTYTDFLATATEQVPWLVENIAVEGSLTLFLGFPASFKTMAALELGFCSAAGHPWLGLAVKSRPTIYVSNEKSKATIADRLRHLAILHPPKLPLIIAHRIGTEFGNEQWDRLAERAETLGRPLVILDTLASLSPGEFDENSTRDMGNALRAIRQLTNIGATVVLLHHPKKPGKDHNPTALSGRGSGRLDGEIDGWVEFRRADPTTEEVTLYARPKDGESCIIPLKWSIDTFGFDRNQMGAACTAKTVAETVANLWDGEPMSAAQIADYFPSHQPAYVANQVTAANKAGLLYAVKRSKTTFYAPPTAAGTDSIWPHHDANV